MIVVPEDREPQSPAALADRLRAHGVTWSDGDVRTGQLRLAGLLGGDTRADGLAAAVLDAWATRRPKPVGSLVNYLSVFSDEQLMTERAVRGVLERAGLAKPTRGSVPKPEWCGHCAETTRQVEDDQGVPSRCPRCHPLLHRPTVAA